MERAEWGDEGGERRETGEARGREGGEGAGRQGEGRGRGTGERSVEGGAGRGRGVLVKEVLYSFK